MLAVVADQSQIAEARRVAADMARFGGFDETAAGRVALVATELATNLLKHAGGGDILMRNFADGDSAGIELLVLDKGPGIGDLRRALGDGYSTAGSPGNGLGAIRRQSDEFAIWSRSGMGTAIVARIRARAASGPAIIGAVTHPCPGETICGDAWRFAALEAGPALVLADGSGHGAAAATAAEKAAAAFLGAPNVDAVRQMQLIHRALASTRGAAAAIARLDLGERMVRFVGVGNISAAVTSGAGMKRMVSHSGTLGHVAPRIREFTYPWESGATVILHSDGVSPRWSLDDYPGLATSHPSLIAGILFRDHRRGKDDAAVVAMRVT